jgi:ubiquitin-like 1-activating enzyme E1 A
MEKQLTEAEFRQYDRSIRLWGIEAQTRMKNARVLVCGLGLAGAEVTKNVVLAGVKTVLCDDTVVRPRDLAGQFFLAEADVGQNVRRVRTVFFF